VIYYDTAGAFEVQALALARRLFAVYDEAIDSLALLPTDDDELALYLDGQLVASQRRDGVPVLAHYSSRAATGGPPVLAKPGEGVDFCVEANCLHRRSS